MPLLLPPMPDIPSEIDSVPDPARRALLTGLGALFASAGLSALPRDAAAQWGENHPPSTDPPGITGRVGMITHRVITVGLGIPSLAGKIARATPNSRPIRQICNVGPPETSMSPSSVI